MKVLTASTGQSISLVKQIASSGEGEVWQTQLDGYLAKVYYSPRPERVRKLEVMVAHPPEDPNSQIKHISFAWPKSLLKDQGENCVGFLMPAIADSVELIDVYNPQRRQKVLPGFSWLYLHATAMNVASIVQAIHKAGYVLGDIKPQNILVNNRALPAVIDTDSFQVRHPNNGELYRCPVGSESFTPAELLGKDLATIEQTEVHDRFRLAVIIHLLLFGDHPFKGKWTGAGDSPNPNVLIRQGFWPYASNSPIQVSPLTIPLDIVHPDVQNCFLRAFNEGHANPTLRPTAQAWARVLKLAISELKVCREIKPHYYSQTYGTCYWCERKANLGVDIFPAAPNLAHSPMTGILQRIRTVVGTSRNRVVKQVPTTLANPGINVLQRAGIVRETVRSWVTKQTPILAINSQTGWARPATVIGILASVLVLLVFLSKSKIDSHDTGLTSVGILLFLGLIAICFLWIRVLGKSQN
jgi:DNA-binding helix-hairpin-helix protein with protein kinase domain